MDTSFSHKRVAPLHPVTGIGSVSPQQVDLTSRALVSDANGCVLLVRESGAAGCAWRLPGGRVHAGESCTKAVVRCLHDELGVLIWPVSVLLLSEGPADARGNNPVSVVYCARLMAGALPVARAGEITAARWFSTIRLPHNIAGEAIRALASDQAAPLTAW
ncbi:NUDIX hydrolase [Pseudohoeflea coraliihabitans]|uniref:NUDIX hydrolase n=1 Tax=Pseudohoeflea coraliihabitans TaxID=2860393 RepID=A0ABS6WQW0_9HYPH|nr:NUDIX hydrolase [Pseudohoeflea sp. DP4N28-3]MBW3098336.1 NUDIX hydrolase [Pseudohoeflea sp. DP4N28-3]